MAAISEIVNGLTKPNYNKQEVIKLIKRFGKAGKPDKLNIGDCYTSYAGTKKRPCVIFNIHNGLVYSLALSSTKNDRECRAK